jgi:hydrogenase-4 membrane subunit HyfE
MLAVEFRYLASIASIAAMLVLSTGIAIAIGVSAHLPDWAIVSAAFASIATSGILATIVSLRRAAKNGSTSLSPATLEPAAPQPRARYAPIVVSAVVIVLFAFSILSRVQHMNATHWRVGLVSFLASILAGLFFIHLSLRSNCPRRQDVRDDRIARDGRRDVSVSASPIWAVVSRSK